MTDFCDRQNRICRGSLRELKRVLKRHGQIVIINEPLRSILQSEQILLQSNEEKKLGMSEHIYNYWEYKLPFLVLVQISCSEPRALGL